MKYADLRFPEAADKVIYDAAYYDELRHSLNAITNEIDRENAIHFSYCIQNLHKNFEDKIKGLLPGYNKNQQLPHTLYFEPEAKSFPFKKDAEGNKLSDDGLRTFSKVYVHHADMYDMKSIGITWNNLILQYHQSFDFAKGNGKIIEWGKAGQEGCFEGCIGEIYDWYLKNNLASQHDASQKMDVDDQAGTSGQLIKEFLSLEELINNVGEAIPGLSDLKVENALVEIKKVAKIKDAEEFPDDDAVRMLVEYYGYEFENPQKQIEFEARRKRKVEQDKKVANCFEKAKNHLKNPSAVNLNAYVKAHEEAIAVLGQEPLKISVLDKFNQAIESYTQLDNLLSSYEQNPSPEILENIRELESVLRKQIESLPNKPKVNDSEFFRVYGGSGGGGLIVLKNVFREQENKVKSTIEAAAKQHMAELKAERVGLEKSIKTTKKHGNSEELAHQVLELEKVNTQAAILKSQTQAEKLQHSKLSMVRADVKEIKGGVKNKIKKLEKKKAKHKEIDSDLLREISEAQAKIAQKLLFLSHEEAAQLREELKLEKFIQRISALKLPAEVPVVSDKTAAKVSVISKPKIEGPSAEQQFTYFNEMKIPTTSRSKEKLSNKHGKLLYRLDGNIFWKSVKAAQPGVEEGREVAGAWVANHITGGLVPKANLRRVDNKLGIAQDFVTMECFRTDDIKKLNKNQVNQIVVHLIADKAISNYDTHLDNYGIDSNGDVIGIDKGEAFKFFHRGNVGFKGGLAGRKSDSDEFDLELYGRDQSNFYKQVFDRVKAGDLEVDFEDPIIQGALTRCAAMTLDDVKKMYSGYAQTRFKNNVQMQDNFYQEVLQRCHNMPEMFSKFKAQCVADTKEVRVKAEQNARHQAEDALHVIVKQTRSDVTHIKKDIKERLKKLHDAKEQLIALPGDETTHRKCQNLIQEIEGLNGQIEQKFLNLTSTKEPHVSEALKIRDDLHIDKLVAAISDGLASARNAMSEASAAARMQQEAEQQRLLQAQLARQAEEAARLQLEKERIEQEKARIAQEKHLAKKAEEEQARQQQLQAAAQQEAARLAQEKERKQQEQALRIAAEKVEKEKLATQKVKSEKLPTHKEEQAHKATASEQVAAQLAAERVEQQRLAAEYTRLQKERERLKEEQSAQSLLKPRDEKTVLKAECKAQEEARREQERLRAAQERNLKVERSEQEQKQVQKPKPKRKEEEKHPRVKQVLNKHRSNHPVNNVQQEKAKETSKSTAEVVFDDANITLGTMKRILSRFGDNKNAIEISLKNQYQGKRTEKKLKGLLQSFAINAGYTFVNKRDRQISGLADVFAKLQQEGTGLSEHEKGVILSGALQSVIDAIQNTERSNVFQSRLLTICQDLKAELHGAKIHNLEPNQAKICFHAYQSGGVETFRDAARTTAKPRQNLG